MDVKVGSTWKSTTGLIKTVELVKDDLVFFTFIEHSWARKVQGGVQPIDTFVKNNTQFIDNLEPGEIWLRKNTVTYEAKVLCLTNKSVVWERCADKKEFLDPISIFINYFIPKGESDG